MEITIGLSLPRDDRTVGVARRLCREVLRVFGVDDRCRSDIEGALSEACTNVVDHSGTAEHYDVDVVLMRGRCVITVTDSGASFDADAPRPSDARAESGRGIQLMRALVDRVRFESRPEAGTIVRLEKQLTYLRGDP